MQMKQLMKAALLTSTLLGLSLGTSAMAQPDRERGDRGGRGQRSEQPRGDFRQNGGGNFRQNGGGDFRQNGSGERSRDYARPSGAAPVAQSAPPSSVQVAPSAVPGASGQRSWNDGRDPRGSASRPGVPGAVTTAPDPRQNWSGDRGNANAQWQRDRGSQDRNSPDRGFDNRDGRDRNWDNRNGNDRNWNDRQVGRDPRFNGRPQVQGQWNGQNRWSGSRPWSNDWRNDRRYNWQDWRRDNRQIYRLPRYNAPYGWRGGYSRFSVGIFLNSFLYSNSYWINDPYTYRLPPAYEPLRWVRYYNDALLIDIRDGYVVDVAYDIFW